MGAVNGPILDERGTALFSCSACGETMTKDDFFNLGLRLPDDGESREDYFAAELLDSVKHAACGRSRQAASQDHSAH